MLDSCIKAKLTAGLKTHATKQKPSVSSMQPVEYARLGIKFLHCALMLTYWLMCLCASKKNFTLDCSIHQSSCLKACRDVSQK